MSSRAQLALALVPLLVAADAARAQPGDDADSRTFLDEVGNSVIRRTDSCNCGPLLPGTGNLPGQGLPDVEKIIISPWQSPSPSTDPYAGSVDSHFGAHLVRIDVVFVGLVNPPGPLALNSVEYDPFRFGTNPVYGFVEIDVDNDRDTGGDQTDPAANHYLANAARFGCLPAGMIGARAAKSADDLFQPWNHAPQINLSGADWVLSLCGCFPVTPVYKSNPASATFGPGDTWIVEGRFFQRSSAYQHASLMTGGSAPGMYDPVVRLRFQHSVQTGRTTISLVYPLDNFGAAQLISPGTQPQPMNFSASDQTSIAEGVNDLIIAAEERPLFGLEYQVTHRWVNKTIFSAIDTTRWRPSFIVGTAYAQPTDGLYVWTDLGFNCTRGDVTGDGRITLADRQAVTTYIAQEDGGPNDADGVINGQVSVAGFGTNFNLFDTDSSGAVEAADQPPCPADFDRSGVVGVQDLFSFLAAWFANSPAADFNRSGVVSVQDIWDFLAAWFSGC